MKNDCPFSESIWQSLEDVFGFSETFQLRLNGCFRFSDALWQNELVGLDFLTLSDSGGQVLYNFFLTNGEKTIGIKWMLLKLVQNCHSSQYISYNMNRIWQKDLHWVVFSTSSCIVLSYGGLVPFFITGSVLTEVGGGLEIVWSFLMGVVDFIKIEFIYDFINEQPLLKKSVVYIWNDNLLINILVSYY